MATKSYIMVERKSLLDHPVLVRLGRDLVVQLAGGVQHPDLLKAGRAPPERRGSRDLKAGRGLPTIRLPGGPDLLKPGT